MLTDCLQTPVDPKNRSIEMTNFVLTEEFITLAQVLKAVGIAGSGGEAKNLARSGIASVNGTPEIQPGKKLRVGDKLAVKIEGRKGIQEWTMVTGE
jgi:ribosome-associated protein